VSIKFAARSRKPLDYDREKLRNAWPAGRGVAVINVGAATESEMKEKKARVEDALHATRAAVEEGIVAGGGVGPDPLFALTGSTQLSGDEQIGVDIVKRAIEEPPARPGGQRRSRRLHRGAGSQKAQRPTKGYNVATAEYEDLVKAGVVDPKRSPVPPCRTRPPLPVCPDHRMPHHRDSGEGKPAPNGWRPWRRHGRHGLLSRPF